MDAETGGGGGEAPIIVNDTTIRFPNQVLYTILKSLGPLELVTCRRVCRIWREEVNRRSTALKEFHVTELQNLLDGINLLKAQSPPFEIQYLILGEGIGFYPTSPSFIQFIEAISPLTLGKLKIEEKFAKPHWIQPHQVQMILKRFPNIFHLEFETENDKYEAERDCSFIFQAQDHLGQGTNSTLPSLKTLIYPNRWCSLRTILSSCPNMTSLYLSRLLGGQNREEGEFSGSTLKRLRLGHIDPRTLRELREIGVRLTHLNLSFRDDDEPRDLIHNYREFISTQALSLEDLTLTYDLISQMPLPLFPLRQPLWTLSKLTTGFGELDNVLDSVPELLNLTLTMCGSIPVLERFLPYPYMSRSESRKERPSIKALEIKYTTQSYEITMFGTCFNNLNELVLDKVTHGLLHTVFLELTRLTSLTINEEFGDKEDRLRDSDFIRTSSTSIEPYIGNMSNLKKLVIGFILDIPSPCKDSLPPYITDAILTKGIFDIVGQLDLLKISGTRFTQETLETLRSSMIPHLEGPEVFVFPTYHHYVKSKAEPIMGQMESVWTTTLHPIEMND